MEKLIEKCISEIENFYDKHNYNLGWRFLSCSQNVLLENPSIALITLNPAGNDIPKDHPFISCENGNAYTHEAWGNSKAGKSPLQIQIQLMFAKLKDKLNTETDLQSFIESSLTGQFIPFRSPRIKDLSFRKEAFEFGNTLWSSILSTVNPKYFICIDTETYKHIKFLLSETYNTRIELEQKLSTGWGNYQADLITYSDGKRLLRLPHLSTFKLFTSDKCKESIDNIFTKFTT